MGNVPATSTDDHWLPGAAGRRLSRSAAALWFFGVGGAAIIAAGLLAAGLMATLGRSVEVDFHLPGAFTLTTLLLAWGSVWIQSALRAVRRERQALLRRRLRESVLLGAVFMGVQTYALWTILPEKSPEEASTGVAPFAVMLAALHGLHFLIATFFVSYVAVQAHGGRYDHEYHWGVTACAGFWHALGIAWLAILAMYSIVAW